MILASHCTSNAILLDVALGLPVPFTRHHQLQAHRANLQSSQRHGWALGLLFCLLPAASYRWQKVCIWQWPALCWVMPIVCCEHKLLLLLFSRFGQLERCTQACGGGTVLHFVHCSRFAVALYSCMWWYGLYWQHVATDRQTDKGIPLWQCILIVQHLIGRGVPYIPYILFSCILVHLAKPHIVSHVQKAQHYSGSQAGSSLM